MFHRYIGSPPCDRNRNPTVYTTVRYVTNSQPDIQCARWNRGVGRPDEVYVCSVPHLGSLALTPPARAAPMSLGDFTYLLPHQMPHIYTMTTLG